MKTVYTADRSEGGIFVCFSGEGWRIVFEDGGNGVISEILPPDEEKIKNIRARFDKIFKKNS